MRLTESQVKIYKEVVEALKDEIKIIRRYNGDFELILKNQHLIDIYEKALKLHRETKGWRIA